MKALISRARVQSSKLSVNDVVAAEPVHSLPPASLVVLQVSRLRPKGADEARFETAQLCSMFEHLQGIKPAAPGARPCRWPATVGHELYLTDSPLILGCKVRISGEQARSRSFQVIYTRLPSANAPHQ